MRVAFVGLAHSHPYADAANLTDRGAEIVGAQDTDAAAATAFVARFGGTAVATVEDVHTLAPDLVIATPRADEAV